MDAYYRNQARSAIPYFSGPARQRGSGIGALVAGVGRFALPFVKQYVAPAAKSFGRELIRQAVPELLDAVTKKKAPRQAIKQTLVKTTRKQLGRGRSTRRRRRRRRQSSTATITNQKPRKRRRTRSKGRRTKKRTRSSHSINPTAKRSRLSFFSNVRGI